MKLYTKYESSGPCSLGQEDFLNAFWKPIFLHRDLLMQLTGTVDARTDARTHGRWTTDNGPSQKLTLSTLCSGELKKKLNLTLTLRKVGIEKSRMPWRHNHVIFNGNNYTIIMIISITLGNIVSTCRGNITISLLQSKYDITLLYLFDVLFQPFILLNLCCLLLKLLRASLLCDISLFCLLYFVFYVSDMLFSNICIHLLITCIIYSFKVVFINI